MKIPNKVNRLPVFYLSLARIVSEDSQLQPIRVFPRLKSSKDS